MTDDDKALKDIVTLRARHTAKKPALTFAKALQQMTTAAPGSPAQQDAVLAFLTWSFTPLSQGCVDRTPAFETAKLAEHADTLDTNHRQQFADNVLLNVGTARDYRLLWPLIVAWVPADTLATHLLAALKGNNWLHVHNALELPYQVLGRRAGYAFTPHVRHTLRELAQAFAELAVAPELVRQGAQQFELPR